MHTNNELPLRASVEEGQDGGMDPERRAYWTKPIAEQEASGASIRAFCKQRAVSDDSFYFWRKRLRQNEPVEFALLKTVASKDPQSQIELFLAGWTEIPR